MSIWLHPPTSEEFNLEKRITDQCVMHYRETPAGENIFIPDVDKRRLSGCRFDSLLLVTYGRSGSTLLQGVLNSIPGVLIKGENKNFLFPLYQSFIRMRAAKGMPGNTPRHPWYGADSLNPERFAHELQALVRQEIIGDRDDVSCYGFKEIRYGFGGDNLRDFEQLQDPAVFEDYLNFLGIVFPNPCFLFNTRDARSVAASAWWRKMDEAKVLQQIESLNRLFAGFTKKYPDRSFLIDYADVSQQGENLKRLFAYLGVEFDEERISEVIARPHSYQPKGQVPMRSKPQSHHTLNRNRIAKIIIDALPKQVVPGATIDISGVVFSKVGCPAIAGIAIRGIDDAVEGIVGLPSPRIAKLFPNNPMATNARFNITGVKPRRDETLKVLARFVDGQTAPIALIDVDMKFQDLPAAKTTAVDYASNHWLLEGVTLMDSPFISDVVRSALHSKRYESSELSLLKDCIEDGDSIVEAGGGLGLLAIYALRSGKVRSLQSYEAHPDMVEVILGNQQANGINYPVINAAIGAENGRTKFLIRKDFWGSSTVAKEIGINPIERELDLEMVDINNAIASANANFLIMDIEGGEALVVPAIKLEPIQKILIELHPQFIGKQGVNKIINHFNDAGFSHVNKGQAYLFRRRVENTASGKR